MKNLLILLFLTGLLFTRSFAQVSVNTDGIAPDSSAMLDVKSANRGLLIPRIALTGTLDLTTIASPATSLLIYNTATAGTSPNDVTPGYYYWSGAAWSRLSVSAGGSGTTNYIPKWTSTGALGNSILYNDTSHVGIGTATPGEKLDVAGRIWQTNTGQSVFLGEGAGANDDLSENRNIFIGYEAGKNTTTGDDNVANGHGALYTNTTGMNNTAIGGEALFSNTTGIYNTATGYGTLYSNTTGKENMASGLGALYYNTTGDYNTANGTFALYYNTIGNDNTAIGNYTLLSNETGYENTAIGTVALLYNYTGYRNTASGVKALYSNIDGSNNTATGVEALYSNLSGYKNVATGTNSLYGNTTGIANTANGDNALSANTTGNKNTASGEVALFLNTTGDFNTADGDKALYSNTTGSNNTAIGHNADVAVNNLVNATAIGAYAIVGQSNSLVLGGTGDYGVKVGIGTPTPSTKLDVIGAVKITDGTQGASKVLTSDANGLASWQVPASSSSAWLLTGNAGTVAGTNFIGTTDSKAFDIRTDNLLRTRITTKGAIETYNTGYSVFLGEGAGANDDLTANNNVAVGFRSLYNNTVRSNLVAVGDSALFNNGIGATGAAQASGNTAIGSKALFANTTGRDNTANGNDALYSNTTGYNNTANGKSALYSNSSGNYNTANGINALTSNATGNLNTANGANSLYSNIGGHSNTAIGTDALYNNTTGSNNTALGYQAEVGSNNLTNVTVVGATAVASASNQVRLGNGAVTTLYCMGAYTGTVGTTNRDLFVDNNGKIGYTSSSARYKDNITNLESVDWLYQLRPVNFTYKTDENKVKQYGLIAEEVQKVKPEFVSYNQDGRPETVSYSSMISPLIKALQEQRALNESQQKQIDELKSMVRELMSQK